MDPSKLHLSFQPLQFPPPDPVKPLRRSSRKPIPRAPRFEDNFDAIYGPDHRMSDDTGEHSDAESDCSSCSSIADSLSSNSEDGSWNDDDSTSDEEETDESDDDEGSH